MQAGKLNKRITIQQQTKAKNSINESITTWVTFKTVWASIEPAVGNQFYQSLQLDSRVTGKIRIRYLPNLNATMRIQYGERYFNIVSIIQIQENKKETVIMYSENLD